MPSPSVFHLLPCCHASGMQIKQSSATTSQNLHVSNKGVESWNEFYELWHSIVRSPDEETFHKRMQELGNQYLPQYPEEVGVIKTNWLGVYKEKIVNAWVDQHLP